MSTFCILFLLCDKNVFFTNMLHIDNPLMHYYQLTPGNVCSGLVILCQVNNLNNNISVFQQYMSYADIIV